MRRVETNARLSGRQVSANTIVYPKIPMARQPKAFAKGPGVTSTSAWTTQVVGSGGYHHVAAEGDPSDAAADVFGCGGELVLDRVSPLLEVLPAFVVDGDGDAGANEAAQLEIGRAHV